MDKKVVIVTHDGMFHADDVFAVAAILCLLDAVPVVATIVRTRDEDVIRKADFVVDVGSVYDSEKNCFDHHQIGGAGQRTNGIPYGSFGLVWQKFGDKIAVTPEVSALVDRNLVVAVDADDTGVDIFKKVFPDVVPFCVGDCVHNFRPTWQEPVEILNERFLEAVAFGRKVLERAIVQAKAFVAGRAEALKAYENVDDRRIVVLEESYPHEGILASLPEPLFSVYPRPDGTWTAKAVRDDVSSFKNRRDFPMEWAGKRDAELARVTGVPDAIFCHTGRFMVVARSREGALKLARQALESKV